MSYLIDKRVLYKQTAEWEAQALAMVEKTMHNEDPTEWRRWSAVLTERTAFKHDVADAPTVEVPTWIPCSERLPESDEYVIITILDNRGDTPYRYADFGWYLDKANCWIVDAEQRTDVIAWMPLPRAFKESEA